MFVFWFPNTYLNVHIPYLKTEGGSGGGEPCCVRILMWVTRWAGRAESSRGLI